ncbi:MAG: hypothetical protein J1F43_02550 [Muribaculaceae bacterium]|nr:hypothetical protein [Muribaculaceae bacterium]
MNQSKFYVEIESVEYPAESSLGARLLFKKETGKEVREISGLSDSIIWLWWCVKSASARSKNPMELDCQEFADSCTMEVLDEWSRVQNQEAAESKKDSEGDPDLRTLRVRDGSGGTRLMMISAGSP